MQCSPGQESCWCILSSGEEVPGTRVVGSQPACESKMCPSERLSGGGGRGLPLCSFTRGGGFKDSGQEGLRTWEPLIPETWKLVPPPCQRAAWH